MVNSYANEIWPLAVYFVMVILLVITMLVLSWLLGQRRREAATNDPFESGIFLSVARKFVFRSNSIW